MPNKFLGKLGNLADSIKDAAEDVIDRIDDKFDMPIIIGTYVQVCVLRCVYSCGTLLTDDNNYDCLSSSFAVADTSSTDRYTDDIITIRLSASFLACISQL